MTIELTRDEIKILMEQCIDGISNLLKQYSGSPTEIDSKIDRLKELSLLYLATKLPKNEMPF